MRSYMAQSHFVLEVGFSLSLCVCVFFGGFFALPLGWEKQDPFGLISDQLTDETYGKTCLRVCGGLLVANYIAQLEGMDQFDVERKADGLM